MDDLEFYLYPIFWDATKILSFASGGKWNTEDRETILEKGMQGLEEILVKYHLLDETTKDMVEKERQERITKFIEEFKCLLQEPRYPARTQIHDLLFKEGFDDSIVNQIADLTEMVTMGELSWGEYINLSTELVRQLEKEFSK